MEGLTLDMLLGALLIFALRIVDVSLGTLRIGMLVRGKRRLAGVLSFFESLIWLVAAAQVLGKLESPIQFVAYAGGYATGDRQASAGGAGHPPVARPRNWPEVLVPKPRRRILLHFRPRR